MNDLQNNEHYSDPTAGYVEKRARQFERWKCLESRIKTAVYYMRKAAKRNGFDISGIVSFIDDNTGRVVNWTIHHQPDSKRKGV